MVPAFSAPFSFKPIARTENSVLGKSKTWEETLEISFKVVVCQEKCSLYALNHQVLSVSDLTVGMTVNFFINVGNGMSDLIISWFCILVIIFSVIVTYIAYMQSVVENLILCFSFSLLSVLSLKSYICWVILGIIVRKNFWLRSDATGILFVGCFSGVGHCCKINFGFHCKCLASLQRMLETAFIFHLKV